MIEINREILRHQLSLKTLHFMKQTHSDLVKVIENESGDLYCDALVSTTIGVGIAALAADCMPITFSAQGVIGVAHVGRVGLVKGIASKTVRAMRDLGATEITATIGPSICGTCYEVSPQMYQEITTRLPNSATSEEHHSLNMQAAVLEELLELEVRTHDTRICTLESSEYFSYRGGDATFRQAGVISL